MKTLEYRTEDKSKWPGETYKNIAFVKAECASVAMQLKKVEAQSA